MEENNNASTCLSGKEDYALNRNITIEDANKNLIVSDCCNATYDPEAEMCMDCKDHCGSITLEQ